MEFYYINKLDSYEGMKVFSGPVRIAGMEELSLNDLSFV